MMKSFRELIVSNDVFSGYAYAYPHKTAYHRLAPRVRLRDAWSNENKAALFLYAHLPFCEMRCGFCNLFTTTNPKGNIVSSYLDALERQTETVLNELGNEANFARLAIGGGTPTFLEARELSRLFEILNQANGVHGHIPKAVEASPATVDAERIDLLRKEGITRVSLGVQSFLENETRALGRLQKPSDARQALRLLAEADFPCVNVDLIYGAPGQTSNTWRQSLEEALAFEPEEIYLYPLYVRPLTGLNRLGTKPIDDRLELYRLGRDFLLSRGYRQISMRLFRALRYVPSEGPVYCCQEDGMVGLGAGARSYTTSLHYSSEYAVGKTGVEAILHDYIDRNAEQFSYADYGCELNEDEQRRRYLLKSLLRADGLNREGYHNFFGTDLENDFPQLSELHDENLIESEKTTLRLNARGLELSDVIGPWLFSPKIRQRMEKFELT